MITIPLSIGLTNHTLQYIVFLTLAIIFRNVYNLSKSPYGTNQNMLKRMRNYPILCYREIAIAGFRAIEKRWWCVYALSRLNAILKSCFHLNGT